MKRRDFWNALGLGALALVAKDAKAEPELPRFGTTNVGGDLTITTQGCINTVKLDASEVADKIAEAMDDLRAYGLIE